MKHLRKILPAALFAVVAIAVICVISISSKNNVSKESETALASAVVKQDAVKNDSTKTVDPAPDKAATPAPSETKAPADSEKENKETKETEKTENTEKSKKTKKDKKANKKKSANTSSTSVMAVGIVNGDVNLRKKASTDSEILSTLSDGTAVSILAKKDEWYQVCYDGKKGYMSADYVTKKTSASGLKGYAKIIADVLYMRIEPDASGDVVAMIAQDEYVRLRGFKDGWYKVSYGDYKGYMSGEYLSLVAEKPQPVESAEEVPADNSNSYSQNNNSNSNNSNSKKSSKKKSAPADSPSFNSGSDSDLVNYALSLCGVPYVYGGDSPSGFDCSGFTMYVYNHFDYSLPHGATSQMGYCYDVSMSELSPGDLVFFFDPNYGSSGASHVGIYIGGGQFVHASSYAEYAVMVSSFYDDSDTGDYYASTFIGGGHIA